MFRRAVASEVRKLLARRTTLSLLLSITLLPLVFASALTLLIRGGLQSGWRWFQPNLSSPQDLLQIIFGTASLFCALLGMLAITSEYSTLTIMRTYQVFRNRYPVLVGKIVVLAAFTLIASSVAVSLAMIELLLLGGQALALSSPWLLIWGFVANGVIITLFGYGLGLIISHSLPTVLTIITFLYILPEVIRVILETFLTDFQGLQWYLPTEAAAAAVEAALSGSSYSGLQPAVGVMVAVAETALVLAVGIGFQRRKEVT